MGIIDDWLDEDEPLGIDAAEPEPPYKQLKPWHEMLKKGELDQVTLTPDFLPDQEIKERELRHKYYPRPSRIKTEITRSTIFWHAPGRYSPTPPLKQEIAGVFLKGVLSRESQDMARAGLDAMKWPLPHRPETETAIKKQRGYTTPGELTMGYTRRLTIERTKPVREQAAQFRRLAPLMNEMNACFARVLPVYYRMQNIPKSENERWAEIEANRQPEFGGIGREFRQFLTAFSTLALLKSCPSSIHKDGGNARPDQASFTCLTSVGELDEKGNPKFKGGQFCLIEYGVKIPVKPGDIFIGQTNREWHCNIGHVRGLKYSIVCYYIRSIGSPKLRRGKSTLDSPQSESKEGDMSLPNQDQLGEGNQP